MAEEPVIRVKYLRSYGPSREPPCRFNEGERATWPADLAARLLAAKIVELDEPEVSREHDATR